MKYKHLAMIMGVMITATSVGSTATVFAEESKTESTQDAGDTTEDTAEASDEDAEKKNDDTEQTKENEILGEVKSVEDGKITIAVGTRKEMGQPGEQPQGGENGEASSMLDLTGEEQEITVTDSTVITKQSMGGGQGAPDGEAPEKPDGEASDSDNTDSEAPKKPEGEAPDGQGAPDGAGQTEEITLDDIKEGDVVAITLDDDGNAATITVQSMDMGGGQGGPGGQASGVTAMMQQMNTAQMKQFPIPLWNLQEQTKTQHLFPMVQRLPSAMTQSQEHLPTARAVITPASMV